MHQHSMQNSPSNCSGKDTRSLASPFWYCFCCLSMHMHRDDLTSSPCLKVLSRPQVYQQAAANMSGVSAAMTISADFISGTMYTEVGGKFLMPSICSRNSLMPLVHLLLYHRPPLPSSIMQDTWVLLPPVSTREIKIIICLSCFLLSSVFSIDSRPTCQPSIYPCWNRYCTLHKKQRRSQGCHAIFLPLYFPSENFVPCPRA